MCCGKQSALRKDMQPKNGAPSLVSPMAPLAPVSPVDPLWPVEPVDPVVPLEPASSITPQGMLSCREAASDAQSFEACINHKKDAIRITCESGLAA